MISDISSSLLNSEFPLFAFAILLPLLLLAGGSWWSVLMVIAPVVLGGS